MSSATDTLDRVREERIDQIIRHGFGPAHDGEHTRNDWIALICAYAGQGVDEEERTFGKLMVKVAALAVAAVEAVDRGDLRS